MLIKINHAFNQSKATLDITIDKKFLRLLPEESGEVLNATPSKTIPRSMTGSVAYARLWRRSAALYRKRSGKLSLLPGQLRGHITHL